MESRRTPVRYLALEHLCLPLAMPVYRRLVRSWATTVSDRQALARFLASPRALALTFHGMLPHLPAFLSELHRVGRRAVVLLSNSDDGRLLAAALACLGVDAVIGSDEERGVAGALELARRVRSGDVGVVAIDGPLGPRGVVKPGAVRIALQQSATIGVALTRADRGWTFGSWDAAHLPYPRARVEMRFSIVEALPSDDWRLVADRVAQVMAITDAGAATSPRGPR